jgi:hypothetical protein
MKKTIILNLLFLFLINCYSQDTIKHKIDTLPAGKIFLTGKNTGNMIILRWVPGSAGVWHLSNNAGYMVEKLAFKDTTSLKNGQYQLLTPDTLKPWSLEKWEPIAGEASGDKYAAIAAQAIWGKRNKSDIENTEADIFEKAREFENLFSIALLAAEYSANAALASALRYEDKDIDPAMTYFYRVYSLAASPEYPIDTAYVVINAGEAYLPASINIEVLEEKENEVIIGWDRIYENEYSSWFIERSEIGSEIFLRLNDYPYIDSDIGDIGEKEAMIYYRDSVPMNYIKYQYRVIGLNTYSELSPPSNIVTGMGKDKTPPPPPQNILANEIAPHLMEVKWLMPIITDDLQGFLITRSDRIKDKQFAITNEVLPARTRSFIDTTYDEMQNNWYYVYAVDTAGNASVGLPQFGSITDSIAPDPPIGLTGSIDTNGIVTIHWLRGKDKDIAGYTLFSANQADHTFINVNNIPVSDTTFTDSITLKTLTENIYYRVSTVDWVGNVSEFSEILKIKKPDIVPPVPPVFTDYDVTDHGIFLSWVQSTSHDAKTHILYRRTLGSEDWDLIFTTDELKEQDKSNDETAIAGKTYEYKIIAQDDDGLNSPVSSILTLTAIDFSEIIPIEDIQAELNQSKDKVTIRWSYLEGGENKYQIFRAVNDGGFYLLKEIKDPLRQISDEVQKGRIYEYTIVVVKNDKKKSGFSKSVKIDLTDNDENSK